MTNYQDIVKTLIADFEKRFGDAFTYSNYCPQWESDEQTKENYDRWIAGYACFVINPQITEPIWDRIVEIVKGYFPDGEVTFRRGCFEFEIIRRGNFSPTATE